MNEHRSASNSGALPMRMKFSGRRTRRQTPIDTGRRNLNFVTLPLCELGQLNSLPKPSTQPYFLCIPEQRGGCWWIECANNPHQS